MTRRAHFGLRLFGVLLLAAVALWPRSRSHTAHHYDRAASSVVGPAHLVVTTAARLDRAEPPRPRAAKATTPESSEDGTTAVELSALTN